MTLAEVKDNCYYRSISTLVTGHDLGMWHQGLMLHMPPCDDRKIASWQIHQTREKNWYHAYHNRLPPLANSHMQPQTF